MVILTGWNVKLPLYCRNQYLCARKLLRASRRNMILVMTHAVRNVNVKLKKTSAIIRLVRSLAVLHIGSL